MLTTRCLKPFMIDGGEDGVNKCKGRARGQPGVEGWNYSDWRTQNATSGRIGVSRGRIRGRINGACIAGGVVVDGVGDEMDVPFS